MCWGLVRLGLGLSLKRAGRLLCCFNSWLSFSPCLFCAEQFRDLAISGVRARIGRGDSRERPMPFSQRCGSRVAVALSASCSGHGTKTLDLSEDFVGGDLRLHSTLSFGDSPLWGSCDSSRQLNLRSQKLGITQITKYLGKILVIKIPRNKFCEVTVELCMKLATLLSLLSY